MKQRLSIRLMTLATTLAMSISFGQVAFVNGASFALGAVAPGSFVTVFGEKLCAATAVGSWIGPRQLPTSLGGCSVTVNGADAMLSFVSPGQVNFIVPSKTAIGTATVVITDGTASQTGVLEVKAAGPGVFSMNGMGVGKGAFLHGLLWQKGPFSITTDGAATPLSLYLTGLDLSEAPVVTIGGVEVKVTWYGDAPGFAGLQQINIELPASMAGVGTVPVTITSNGKTSNVTFMNLLPTTAMMSNNPFWPVGKIIHDNMPRGRETSSIDYVSGGTVLVADEDGDVVRVISLDTKDTIATITLPDGSSPSNVVSSPDGKLAAVALPEQASVALIDLATNDVSTISVGNYPMHLAFTSTSLLVTNHASRSVSVIGLDTKAVIQTVDTGEGPAGIAVSGNTAIVANMQDGTLTSIDLTTFKTTTVTLPENSRPHEVAISGTKAVITMPMSNSCLVYDMDSGTTTAIETSKWKAFGPRAVAVKDNLAFLANQMSASVTVVDLAQGKVVKTFPVDPGPRDLAVAGAQLLVLSQGSGVVDIVDLDSYAIVGRIDGEKTDRSGPWKLPIVMSMSPTSGTVNSTLTLTVNGYNLQGVTSIEFHVLPLHGMGMGNGKTLDSNIKVTDVKPASDGRQVTATIQILEAATAGKRTVKFSTDHGVVMGPALLSTFTVSAK